MNPKKSHYPIRLQITTKKYFMKEKINIIGTEDETFLMMLLLSLFARSNNNFFYFLNNLFKSINCKK